MMTLCWCAKVSTQYGAHGIAIIRKVFWTHQYTIYTSPPFSTHNCEDARAWWYPVRYPT